MTKDLALRLRKVMGLDHSVIAECFCGMEVDFGG